LYNAAFRLPEKAVRRHSGGNDEDGGPEGMDSKAVDEYTTGNGLDNEAEHEDTGTDGMNNNPDEEGNNTASKPVGVPPDRNNALAE
jgi:hypothetical protein